MHVLLYIVMAIVGLAAVGIAILSRYADAQTIRRYVRRAVIVFASAAFTVCVAAACLVSCYSSVTGYLKETLSANTIEELKIAVKLLFNGGSTLSALQALIISSLMFSILGCTALGVGKLALTFICKKIERKHCVEREQNQAKSVNTNYVNRSFLVYEKYNS